MLAKLLAITALIGALAAPAVAAQTAQPTNNFIYDANHKLRPWDKIVDDAFKFSMRQNRGVANYKRECYPKDAQCAMLVIFRDESGGTTTVARMVNARGGDVGHYVCSFNSTEDVRICFNYDARQLGPTMMKGEGGWEAIADDLGGEESKLEGDSEDAPLKPGEQRS